MANEIHLISILSIKKQEREKMHCDAKITMELNALEV